MGNTLAKLAHIRIGLRTIIIGYRFHGLRLERASIRMAGSPPGNSSFSGSHFTDRCSLWAMIVRCPKDAER